MTAARRPHWPWILALALLAGLVAGLFATRQKGSGELPVYVTGAQRMLAGEEIYRPTDLKPFTYPPFFAIPFVPVALLPENVQQAAHFAGNIAWLALILWIVRSATAAVREGASRKQQVVFWVFVLLLAGRHLSAPFENQSHDLLVAAVVGVAALAHARGGAATAGAAAGLAAACKATPLLFLVLFLVQRRWRAGLVLGAVAVALSLLPDLLCPRADGRLAVAAWYTTFLGGLEVGGTAAADGAWTHASFLNQSLSGTMYRLTTAITPQGPFQLDAHLVDLGAGARRAVTLMAQVFVLLLLVVAARAPVQPQASDADAGLHRFGQASAVGCGMVLLSPMSSKSHFCVLVFATAFCCAHLLFRRRDPIVAWLLGATLVLGSLSTKGLVGKDLGNQLLAYGTVTWAALLTLVCCTVVLVRWRTINPQPAAPAR